MCLLMYRTKEQKQEVPGEARLLLVKTTAAKKLSPNKSAKQALAEGTAESFQKLSDHHYDFKNKTFQVNAS